MLFQPRIKRSAYLMPPPSRVDRVASRIRELLSKFDLKAAFRGAAPRVIVGLAIWCAAIAGIRYTFSSSTVSLDRTTSAVSQVGSAAPTPLSATPSLTLVADAQATPAPPAAVAAAVPVAQAAVAVMPGAIPVAPEGTFLNNYDWGQCTWYVAGRREVPGDWGNADTWYDRAKAAGWTVGSNPVVGAIAWTAAGEFGHVAIVESVSADGQSIDISEMNYMGLDIRDNRTVPASDFLYIYQ